MGSRISSWSIALPVYEILQPAAPSPRVHDVADLVDWQLVQNLEWEKSMIWAGKRGTWGEFGTWGEVGAGKWPRLYASGSWTEQYSGDSASCSAGGVADLGWITTPSLQGGRWELERAGDPQSLSVSALPAGGGCELSPILSRSLGTSGLQLETLMALPSTGRAGVGSRVCTETGWGPWCSGGGNFVHSAAHGRKRLPLNWSSWQYARGYRPSSWIFRSAWPFVWGW